jgi:hypothetical protein
MRWLKHLAAAHDDRAICSLLEEFGPAGYGIYWLVLEECAAIIEKNSTAVPSIAHSELKWSHLCHCSVRTFRKWAKRASELGLISCTSIAELVQFSSRTRANRLQIDVPKLLKYRDEYSKKSGHTPDSRYTYTDREAKASLIQKEKHTPPTPPLGGNVPTPPPPEQSPLPETPPAVLLRVRPQQPDAAEDATSLVAQWIWNRHPEARRGKIETVEKHLRDECKHLPIAEAKIRHLRDIDARHARWCASEQWAKKGLVSNLATWFTEGHCRNEAPPPDPGKEDAAQRLTRVMYEQAMAAKGRQAG